MEANTSPIEAVLNAIDKWVQIYNLLVGFQSEKVIGDVGNYVGNSLKSKSKICWNFQNIFDQSVPCVYGSGSKKPGWELEATYDGGVI